MEKIMNNAPQKAKKKRRKISVKNAICNLIIACFVLAGVGMLAYPTAANWYNTAHATRAVADYNNVMNDMSETDFQTMLDGAVAYNANLLKMIDRFEPDEETHNWYCDSLDITGTGIMGYIEIPKISVKLPIYHGTEETTLMVAVGHLEGSMLPVGGIGNHVVMSGHSALPSAKLFTDLAKLEVGDSFSLMVLGNELTYRVREINTVLPEQYEYFDVDPNADLVTLMTCTPYGVNSHRLLVTGERIYEPGGDENIELESPSQTNLKEDYAEPRRDLQILLGVGIAIIIAAFSRTARMIAGARNKKKGR